MYLQNNLFLKNREDNMDKVKELDYRQLRKQWDIYDIPFESTDELTPPEGIIGQERAGEAISFGSKIKVRGYNIYMSGISGTGKTSYAREFFSRLAKKQKTPDDWCYVYNFENPDSTVAIRLPCGLGKAFSQDVRELMQDLRVEIPKAFSDEEYENEKALLFKEFQEKRNDIVAKFNVAAMEQGFQVNTTNSGIYFTPLVDGKPQDEESFNDLDEETKRKINSALTMIQLQAVELMRRIKEYEKEVKDKARDLDFRIGSFVLNRHLDDLMEKYKPYEKVTRYLSELKQDILENIGSFKEVDEEDAQNNLLRLLRRDHGGYNTKYTVHLLVDNSETQGAPVIAEYNPTYNGLFGTIEYDSKLGSLVTDFTLIKPGSLHMANGGYLILQARDILTVPFMWEGLKKVLKTGKICIESLREQYGLVTMATLKPEPIPLDLKVILIGSEEIYRLLYRYDEDFPKLFKIKADFDEEMEATVDNLVYLARFIKGYSVRENGKPFTREAVIQTAHYSSRLVEHQEKFSTRFNDIVEILAEANTWADLAGRNMVTEDDVDKAIKEKSRRSDKYDKKLLELLEDGTLMIETDSEVVGQINGLSVLSTGDFVFGKPSKITAATYIGKSGVVNIEREVDMSGTSHSKGVMILSSYIGSQYAQEMPLTLTASITFEQLYSGVDGDSASSTELYAILSSLAQIPLKQGIAVTGSVNQKGQIQPVGGVTCKVEGFFELCRLRGLTGRQGVIIPYQNIRNLVLKQEVVDAVREGLFHIYPVETIDEGIEILTGVPAGRKLKDGSFEKGTVHEMVYNRLRQYAMSMAQFGRDNK
jgi:lon-related putative ATP-dependent protease